MSVNTAHVEGGGVLIHAGECILLFSDQVTLEFHGQHNPIFDGSKSGKMYLTTHRMIFISKDGKDKMQSFSFPFITLKDVDIEQPVFGANYIKGKVRAQPEGNWIGEAKFKLIFKNGGAIEYGQAMLKAVQMAVGGGVIPDFPPPYSPPTAPMYQAPPPAYAPSPTGYYGWVPPTNVFPHRPEAGTVYMTDSPPPYPGVTGYSYTGYANASAPPAGFKVEAQPSQANGTKSAEGAQSAYYDPNKPQCAYVPPPAYYEQPPSYQANGEKKNQ